MSIDGITGIDSDKDLPVKANKFTQKDAMSKEISKIYLPIRKGLYHDFKKICEEKNVSITATVTQLIICVIAAETDKDIDEILRKEKEFYMDMREHLKDKRNELKRKSTRANKVDKQLEESRMFKMSKSAKNMIKTNPYDATDVYDMLLKEKNKGNKNEK